MSTKTSKFKIIITGGTKGFTSSIYKSQAAVRAFNKELSAASRASKQLDHGLTGMAAKFSALFGGISTVAFGKSIWEAGVATQNLERSFKAITGSSAAAGKEMDFLRKTADDLGLNFLNSAKGYRQLAAAARGTTLEGKQTRDIFLGISEAATVLGMSTDDTAGSLLAISQMISKGNVQAEELRGQLGERLPGAFQLAAKAMGVTTGELDKMLKQGQVAATDLLPKLAKALHDMYGSDAAKMSDGAIQALHRFENAWLSLEKSISDSGFLDVATGRIKDLTNAMDDPEVKARIVDVTNNFFKMADAVMSFIVNHGKAIAGVGAGLATLSTLYRTTVMLTGVWRGLNSAMVQTTGIELLPYLRGLNFTLSMSEIAIAGFAASLGAAAAAGLSLMAGLKIGEELYKRTEPAEQALIKLQNELDRTQAKYRQFSSFKPEDSKSLFEKSENDLKKYKEQLVGAYRYQGAVVNSLYAKSRDTSIWGKATKEAEQAGVELVAARAKLKQLETAMGEYGKVADGTYKKTADNAGRAADSQRRATGKALDAMKAAWKRYADEVTRLQDQIAGREKSLAEQLRAMARTGMSDLGAWQDRKREAQEYEQAAKKAAEAGNFKEAVKLADKAKNAYADLNKEVKSGDQVLISQQQALETSMAGVKTAGDLAIESLKKQQEAAKQAADALNEQSGFQLGDAFTKAGKQAKELADTSKDFSDNWRTAFVNMGKDAAAQIDAIDRNLNDMAKNRDVYIKIHEVAAKATGGPVYSLATGGRLPGYGGGDRIPALLEAGEFIIRKEAVSRFGAGLFSALNNLRLPEIPRFATGGPVTANAPAAGKSVTINFAFPGEQERPRGTFSLSDAEAMQRIMRKQFRLRSS